MATDSTLGTRLRTLRRRARLSQVKLAAELDISPSYLNLIEHNKRRFPAELMFKTADALGVDVREFAVDESGSLVAELMDVLDDPELEDADIKANDVRDLADSHPGLARALVSIHRKWKATDESLRQLAELVLDGAPTTGVDAARLPSEEVNDLVARNMNYFPAVEQAAEELWRRYGLASDRMYEGLIRILADPFGVRVHVTTRDEAHGIVRRFDAERGVLHVSETLPPRSRHFHIAHQIGLLGCGDLFDEVATDPALTTEASRRLARMVLANYFAGAVLMPYERFWEAAETERYDIELLGHRFRTGFEQVCHRLTTLHRPGMQGVPFHLVKVDTAGNVSKRFSGSGIQFARFGGGCPRWNVSQAFLQPGKFRLQLSEMPDGVRYFCVSRTLTKRHGGYREPETIQAIGLGCRVEHAPRVVYADGIDLERAELVRIGVSCRVCPRTDCQHRAFPSVRHQLELDEDVRRMAFYASAAEGQEEG